MNPSLATAWCFVQPVGDTRVKVFCYQARVGRRVQLGRGGGEGFWCFSRPCGTQLRASLVPQNCLGSHCDSRRGQWTGPSDLVAAHTWAWARCRCGSPGCAAFDTFLTAAAAVVPSPMLMGETFSGVYMATYAFLVQTAPFKPVQSL